MSNIFVFPLKARSVESSSAAPPTDYLSFVKQRGQGGGYDYWAVAPTNKYGEDCETGKRLAEEYLAFIGRWPTNGNATLLTCIVHSMFDQAQAGGKWSGLHVGFLARINGCAMIAAVHERDAGASA